MSIRGLFFYYKQNKYLVPKLNIIIYCMTQCIIVLSAWAYRRRVGSLRVCFGWHRLRQAQADNSYSDTCISEIYILICIKDFLMLILIISSATDMMLGIIRNIFNGPCYSFFKWMQAYHAILFRAYSAWIFLASVWMHKKLHGFAKLIFNQSAKRFNFGMGFSYI